MNSTNLKFGDVTAKRSPTFSDCHYVKKIIFSLDYYFLAMFSIFCCIIKYSLAFVNIMSIYSSTLHFILW